MTKHPISVDDETTLDEVVALMDAHHIAQRFQLSAVAPWLTLSAGWHARLHEFVLGGATYTITGHAAVLDSDVALTPEPTDTLMAGPAVALLH
jgi:hypothetical protein